MNAGKSLCLPGLAALAAAGMAIAGGAAAQDVSLNYERLSSMEEPLAAEIGGATFVLKGLLDAALIHDAEGRDTDVGLTGNFQLGALTQLSNRWRIGLTYFGQYVTEETMSLPPDKRYTDNVALSVGGAWGTVAGGNVSGIVREETRRRRGAGNGLLEFDDALGVLDDWGGGYTVRLGPWATACSNSTMRSACWTIGAAATRSGSAPAIHLIVGAVVDENADFDVGATYRRPMDNTDYRLTVRLGRGVHAPAGAAVSFDSTAFGVVGEMIFGSMSLDVGLGYERLSSPGRDAVRRYISSGIRGKTGVLGWSLEAHYGRMEGEDEVSAALGAQYDIARGLSANLGLNHARAKADAGAIRIVDRRDTKGVLSLRYSF